MIAKQPSKTLHGSRRPVRPTLRGPAGSPPKRRSRKTSGEGRTVLDRYFSEIRNYPVLSREDEGEVARAVQQDRPGALEHLVESNLQFVVSVAREYRSMGMPLEDLINEGNIGLIEAARRFDPERGTKFISFAVWWVRKAIRVALTEQPYVVRLPISQVKRMRVVRSTERALADELGRKPTSDELSAKLPANLAGMDPIHRHGIRSSSLDEPIGDKERDTLAELLEDTDQITVEEQMISQEMVDRLADSCARLDDRQRTVISCRFGLGGQRRLTLREIGERVGLSREGVRLVEGKAIERLRKMFSADRPPAPRFAPPRAIRRSGDDFDTAA